MKNKFTLSSVLTQIAVFAFLIAILLAPPAAQAQGNSISASYGPIPVLSLGAGITNSSGGIGVWNTNTLSGTTAFPWTNIYNVTNATSTNSVTNVTSGIVDVTKEGAFCPNVIFSTTSATNSTNTVICQWEPGLDGVNYDTANTSFYTTNVCNGTTQVGGTTNFPGAASLQIGFFYLKNIVVSGTAVLTNVIVQVSGKRVLSF